MKTSDNRQEAVLDRILEKKGLVPQNTPDTEVDEDTKGGVCSKCGAWKGGSYGMDGNGVQHRHTCKPPTNDDLLAEWDELIKVSTKLELRNWLKDLLTSRDTYWKERVRKEVEDALRKLDIDDHNYLTARREIAKVSGIPMMAITFNEHLKVIKEKLGASPITNEDNLK